MPDNKVIKITDNVSWVGVLDRDIVTFDVVMETKYGTSYNSYFIDAARKTVVETVKEKFWDTYLAKLKQVVVPEEIEYIVVNHTEPDHSGCLSRLLEIAPRARVVGSGNAIRYLRDLLGFEFPHLIVKDGQTLDLGKLTLQFVAAANLHWPDSIMTYLQEEKLLFTCDIFGEHYCNEGMFDDVVGDFDDAFRYYFDVIMKPKRVKICGVSQQEENHQVRGPQHEADHSRRLRTLSPLRMRQSLQQRSPENRNHQNGGHPQPGNRLFKDRAGPTQIHPKIEAPRE